MASRLSFPLSFVTERVVCDHRVIILNRGSMFAFQWREFSPPLSSAHRLLQGYHRQKRDRRCCNFRGIPSQPPATREISQWARSLEWRHAGMLNILVGKICISFFLFYCMTSLSFGRIFCFESQKIDGTYQRYNHYFNFFLLKLYLFLLKIGL